ncbi:MAG: methyltransferase domain-containing protein, partial [Parcubacteria group bacterium]|nr:methyltransferase domain-containing protein [Parcubacteria group bacterium]
SPNHEPMLKKRLTEEGIEREIPFVASEDLCVPLLDNSYDNVLIFQALEGVPEPERLIAEATRLLKENGRVIITCRNKWSWFFLTFLWSIRRETVWNLGPFWPLSPRKIFRMLRHTFAGSFSGVSPTPAKIGTLVKKWPFNYLCRLIVFIGEKSAP